MKGNRAFRYVVVLSIAAVVTLAVGYWAIRQPRGAKPDGRSAPASDAGRAFPEAYNGSFDPLAPVAKPVQRVQPPSDHHGPATTVAFDAIEHAFGNVKQQSENHCAFTFTNTGSLPLVIDKAIGSCGCTVPDYPKRPIMPGEKGTISVVYKPGLQRDFQSKTVTVTANTDPSPIVLRITAHVEPGS